MLVNVISLEGSKLRREQFEKEAAKQNLIFSFFNAIDYPNAPFIGCSLSHKAIVKQALEEKKEMVCIAEDDCVFSDEGAFDFFVSSIPKSFDLFLGEVHSFGVKPDNRVNDFCGLTLYVVHSRFYEKFLSVKSEDHLDRQLGKIGKENEFYVCDPFVCRQSNGWSNIRKMNAGLDYLYKDVEFYKK